MIFFLRLLISCVQCTVYIKTHMVGTNVHPNALFSVLLYTKLQCSSSKKIVFSFLKIFDCFLNSMNACQKKCVGVFKHILQRSTCNSERLTHTWYLTEGVHSHFRSTTEIYIRTLIIRVEPTGILRLLKH